MEKKRYEPIRNEAQLDRALKAGARIEFTACGCEYDDPQGGWISPYDIVEFARDRLRRGWCRSKQSADRLRAVHAVQSRPSFLARLFRREAA